MLPQSTTDVNENLEDVAIDSVSFPVSLTSLDSYRHISAGDRQSGVYTALMDAGLTGKAVSYMSCGQEVYTLQCESCGYEHKVAYNCKLRFCSRCAGVKKAGYMKKYINYIESLNADNIRFVTLTIKNVAELRAGVDKIRDCFVKLRHREHYKRRIDGGLYGVEANPDDDGKWNIHIHFIYYGAWIKQSTLSDDWYDITGDSMVVDIKRPDRPSDALRYVLKYVTKGVDASDGKWTGEALVEFVVALSDVRMIQAFGCFLGKVADKEPFDCPNCGYRLWRRLDSEGETVYSPLEIMLWKVRNGRSP